jgi:hypothetical protein
VVLLAQEPGRASSAARAFRDAGLPRLLAFTLRTHPAHVKVQRACCAAAHMLAAGVPAQAARARAVLLKAGVPASCVDGGQSSADAFNPQTPVSGGERGG